MKLDQETWAKVYPYLEEAQDVPPAELPAWLAKLTKEHPDIGVSLRSVLETMDDTEAQSFFEKPIQVPPEEPSRVGQRLGAYTIANRPGCWVVLPNVHDGSTIHATIGDAQRLRYAQPVCRQTMRCHRQSA
jgi:hypothetical protein